MGRSKGHITNGRAQAVLSYLAEAGVGAGAVAASLLILHASSYRGGIGPRTTRALRGLWKEHAKIVHTLREKRVWSATLWRMRREGLIAQDSEEYRITEKGKGALEAYRAKILPDSTRYKTAPSEGVTIVSFDIPERERKKRSWLREALTNTGFEMVQKSVWVGNGGVSEEFIEDLERLKLTTYVSIFGVTKRGMLRVEGSKRKGASA